nr:hypothetical protein GCM10020092_026970 [Actinoplanes digitatis]
MTIPTSSIDEVILDQATAAQTEAPQPGRAKRRKFRFVSNGKALTGIIVLGLYLLFAVIGPWVAPYDPDARGDQLVQPPSAEHWFGTTHLGQDVFSQILVGTRAVMVVGLAAGILATLLSVLIGVTAGYLGGGWDDSLSALSNVFLVIPALPLIIIVTAAVPEGGDTLVALIIGFTSWAWGARILRAQTLSLRRRDYVEASRANGESTWRIIIFEILPNLTAIIASGFVGTVIFAVTSEITLAFIGIGSVSSWNWGTILFWAQSQQALAQGAWWWFVLGRSRDRVPRHRPLTDQLRHRRVRQPAPAQHGQDQAQDRLRAHGADAGRLHAGPRQLVRAAHPRHPDPGHRRQADPGEPQQGGDPMSELASESSIQVQTQDIAGAPAEAMA